MNEPIMLDIRPVAKTNITLSTIGFLDRSVTPPRSLGSATFIQLAGKIGLLTCAHVVKALEDHAARGTDEVGIVMFAVREGAIQNTKFRISHMTMTRIGEPPFGESGPDIAFIELSSNDVATLNAQASMVNGDRQATISRQDQPETKCIEAVAGIIEQWTQSEDWNEGRTLVRMEGLITTGKVLDQTDPSGYDVIQFDIEPNQQVTLPESYAGTSGGGIWRLFYELNDEGDISIVERRLLGVAFFEKPGQIIGHGPTTVYKHLQDRLRDCRQTR